MYATATSQNKSVDEPRPDHRAQFQLILNEFEHEERGGNAEADHVAQAVQLPAEAGGALAHSGQPAVEHVGDHGRQDHVAGGGEARPLTGLRLDFFAGQGDRREAEHAVENSD